MTRWNKNFEIICFGSWGQFHLKILQPEVTRNQGSICPFERHHVSIKNGMCGTSDMPHILNAFSSWEISSYTLLYLQMI